jgi:hypothetical protein
LHELIIQLKVAVWQNEPKIINVFSDAHANCPAEQPNSLFPGPTKRAKDKAELVPLGLSMGKHGGRSRRAGFEKSDARLWRCLVLHCLFALGPQRRQRASDEQRDGGEQEGGGGSAA